MDFERGEKVCKNFVTYIFDEKKKKNYNNKLSVEYYARFFRNERLKC